jgi:hypothetical protein
MYLEKVYIRIIISSILLLEKESRHSLQTMNYQPNIGHPMTHPLGAHGLIQPSFLGNPLILP